MNDERILALIRDGIEQSVSQGQVTQETMILFLLLKQVETLSAILGKLDEVRCGLIDVEQEIAKLNSL